MKNFVKLSKNEMKMVLGGVEDTGGSGGIGGDNCTGNCTQDSDCTKQNEACRPFRPSFSIVPIGFCGVDPA